MAFPFDCRIVLTECSLSYKLEEADGVHRKSVRKGMQQVNSQSQELLVCFLIITPASIITGSPSTQVKGRKLSLWFGDRLPMSLIISCVLLELIFNCCKIMAGCVLKIECPQISFCGSSVFLPILHQLKMLILFFRTSPKFSLAQLLLLKRINA